MRHGVVPNECCGDEEGLAFCRERGGKGWNSCQQVQACSWDACDSSTLSLSTLWLSATPTGWSCHSSATAGLPQEWIPFYFILWLVEDSTAACSWLLAQRLPNILLALELDAFAKAK